MHILSAEQFFSIIMIGLAPSLIFAVCDSTQMLLAMINDQLKKASQRAQAAVHKQVQVST